LVLKESLSTRTRTRINITDYKPIEIWLLYDLGNNIPLSG